MTQRGNRRVRSAGRQISTAGGAELAAVADSLAPVQKSERDKSGPPDFSVEQFRRVARIVVGANLEAASQLGALRWRLSDLLMSAGLIDDGTELGKEFRKLADKEFIDHAEYARRFRKIATSGDPLKLTLYGSMMAELRFALRPPRQPDDPIIVPSYRAHLAASLAQHSVADIQSAARHLAIYHQSQVSRGPRAERALDTVLDELADIFAIITGYLKHRHCLSLSERSLFGKFCQAVLQPHCTVSNTTFSALSRRWERIKEHASRPAERVRRAPKRVLRPRKKQEPTTT